MYLQNPKLQYLYVVKKVNYLQAEFTVQLSN